MKALPCPFCGQTKHLIVDIPRFVREHPEIQEDDDPYVVVTCEGCACEGPLAGTDYDAVWRWNARLPVSETTDLKLEK